MVRRLSVAAALWLLSAAGPVQAMGLGDIKVKSSLNQRFSAVIPFTSLTPDEAANVRARLADSEAFQRAGLDRSSFVGSIRVDAITDGPNPRLELSSKELAREPLLTLLVEVRTPGGTRMLREYTVLLDPVVTPATLNQSAAPSSEFFQTPEEARAGAGLREPSTYGPVGANETLWMVAQAVKPAGVGLDQAMLALYETNRGAFRDGDIDSLRKGSILNVPSAERMQAMGNSAARARVLELSSRDKPPVITPSSPFSSGEPATRPATPPPPPVVAAAPLVPPTTPAAPAPAAQAPAPAPEPAAAAPEATAPEAATGPTPETGEAAPAGPETGTPAPAGTTEAPAVEPPAAEAPAESVAPTEAEPAADAGMSDWVSKLVPVLIALILALIGFAVWRSARERKAQREYEQAAREGAASTMPAPRAGATGSIGASKAATSARAELEALDRQIDDDATRIAPSDDDADRTRMVTTSQIPPYTGPQAADRNMDEAERAVTTQFQANTKEIKLGDNDPLSEAEFHLAYGLYDEAALLLQQASARAPQRTDLRVKLAETYFAAGKATEFEQVAAGLKGQVGDEEWGKLAILGRQLSPHSPLFEDQGDATGADTVLDLSFDDDATQIAPVKVDEGLEFKLEELELPTQAQSPTASPGQGLELDLGEFDLSGTDKSAGSGGKKPSPPPPETLELKDFDLSGTDLAGPAKSKLDVRLEEVEPMVIEDPRHEESLSSSDDAATKLDLARAYVEMGDAEMARSLLDEVAKLGTDDQKREAGLLRERLLG